MVIVVDSENAFDVHTAVIEDVRSNIFSVVAALGLPANLRERSALPQNPFELVGWIAACDALSEESRKVLGDAIKVLRELAVVRAEQPEELRQQTDVACAIIYASRSYPDLERGLALIAHLYPSDDTQLAIRSVYDMIKSGRGRIYGTKDPLAAPPDKHFPRAVFNIRSTLIADAAGAVGAVKGKLTDPRAIAAVAAAASAAAAAETIIDWIWPEDDVPLFPGGTTGPYNPYPSPAP